MRNKIYLLALLLLLMHLPSLAQIGGDYNPSNPGDPGTPVLKHTLTLKASPDVAGYFNVTSTQLAPGESFTIRAYSDQDLYAFEAWVCDGDTISRSASYKITMPDHDVVITGVFRFDPVNPGDPNPQSVMYQLSLRSDPENVGRFNFTNKRFAAGASVSLYAYNDYDNDYQFKHWRIGDTILSTDYNMSYTMPAHNVTIIGQYEFDPASPVSPNVNYWNPQTGEMIIDEFSPGHIDEAIYMLLSNSGADWGDVQMITVAGRMEGYDIYCFNQFGNCTLLDLSRVSGVTRIPDYAFEYSHLESIYLPASIESICYCAFYDCINLSSLTIYAMTPPQVDSYTFYGVPDGLVIYVPAAAISLYQDDPNWGRYTILPIQEDIRTLTVSLPANVNPADYAHMWLELTNTKNGQRMHYVMTDRTSYKFNNIICNTTWDVVLRNPEGHIFGQIDDVEVADDDVSVTFASLSKPYHVILTVKTPNGEDVTSAVEITWTNGSGNYLSQGSTLSGLPLGYQLTYRLNLSQELAMKYNIPSTAQYTITNGNNHIVFQLEPIGKITVSGLVKDAKTGLPLKGANVTASQVFADRYDQTQSSKTDGNGLYTMEIAKVPTTIGASASDYINKSVTCDVMTSGDKIVVPDLLLDPITGATITVDFTYTPAHQADEAADIQNWYADFNNVDYTIFNKTQNRSIGQFSAQFPQIVLLEDVNDGDELKITATSRKNAFTPVETTVTLSEQKASATFSILELGKIAASFKQNSNTTVVGTLYDATGKYISNNNYNNDASLTLANLQDGSYTLVTMGYSRFFNTIYDLAQLPQTGLKEHIDYVQNTVEVNSGIISKIDINSVPLLDESKFYYTGESTSFTVNKASIVVGNYLTLTGHIDFKPVYAGNVSNVQLIVDLPESCSFVENSVMVGNNTSSYTINGNQITIPIARYTDRVRLCVVPTVGGNYAPSAFAQFDIDGETITQPIGAANYIVKDLSINVPSTTAKTNISITGTAIGACDVQIFDNGMLIGQTRSLANGTWSSTCELDEPYNLSTHRIHAIVTTSQGVVLQTEMAECFYDKNAIEVDNVVMLYDNPEMGPYNIVFDFINGTVSPSSYYFFPYKNWPNWSGSGTEPKEFTFVADLTNNDTTVVSGVTLYIHTNNNEIRELAAAYDKNQDKWVASSYFEEISLPVNVSLAIYANKTLYADRGYFDLLVNQIDEKKDEAAQTLNEIDELNNAADAIDQQMAIDEEAFANLEILLDATTDNEEMAQLLVQWLAQAGMESSIEDFTADIPDTIDQQYIHLLISKGQELIDSSDDTDYTEAVDALLDQVDETLENDNRFDYIASLRSAQSDTITIDTEEGTSTIFRTTLENFGDIPIEISDTIRLEMTDGCTIYIYLSTADEVVMVDSLENSVWYMHAQHAAQLFAKSPLRARGDFVAAMNTAIHDLETAGRAVLNIALQWIKDREAERAAQKALMQTLEQQQALLLGKNAGLQIRITEIEKELQALTSNDVIPLEQYFDIVERDELVNKLKLEKANVLKKIEINKSNINKLARSLTRCSARIVALSAIIGQLYELYNVGKGLFTTISYAQEAIQDHGHWYSLIDNILPCKADEARAVALKNRCESNWSDIAWSKGYYPAIGMSGLMTLINGYMLTNKAAKFVVRALISAISEYVNSTAKVLFENASRASRNWYPTRYAEYLSLKCTEEKDEPDKPKDPDDKKDPPTPPTHPMHDPSGFVYEGVPSNRLEGVTATCFYKETVEDMYGDLHDEVVLWDAEQYGQENPLLTDKNGYYRWDVPIGMWQVKYEKAGYETTYSDWLPVPPPQLDVNIGMVQMRQPEVIKARAYPQAVELEFDKFMLPETLTEDNITVSMNGTAVSGTIELLNAEVDDPTAITSLRRAPGTGLTLASKVRFNADKPFNSDHVTLHVKEMVENYAGLQMNEDFECVLDVELKIQSIEADSIANILYGDSRQLTVTVLPANASKGKMLTVRSTSPMIATTDAETYAIDRNGQAVITVYGELPGMTSLLYGIEGYDLTAATLVNVMMENQMSVATPTASIASGSEVEMGTAVYLQCATEGATIYYTLDGSCPCDDTPARMIYDGSPIIINGDVTIKAMATAPDLYDSDVATFVYRIGSGLKGDVNNDGEVNIADINTCAGIILGDQVDADTRKRADVNDDGEVTIADMNMLIDMVLDKKNGAKPKTNTTDLMHMNDLSINPGDVRTLYVTLDHATRYSAAQCDVVLPAGLTLVDVATVNGNVSKTRIMNDTTSRTLTCSMSRLPFSSDDQPVIMLTVRADAALALESLITLNNIVVSGKDNKAWHIADCVARVDNSSGVNDLTATADRVWTESRYLCISTQRDGVARVVAVNGIMTDVDVQIGVNRHELEPGIYVVVLNGKSHKIIVK